MQICAYVYVYLCVCLVALPPEAKHLDWCGEQTTNPRVVDKLLSHILHFL